MKFRILYCFNLQGSSGGQGREQRPASQSHSHGCTLQSLLLSNAPHVTVWVELRGDYLLTRGILVRWSANESFRTISEPLAARIRGSDRTWRQRRKPRWGAEGGPAYPASWNKLNMRYIRMIMVPDQFCVYCRMDPESPGAGNGTGGGGGLRLDGSICGF